ncbi:MAG: glycoside hydrolase [Acidobacteria bacterium]|nr:glycoside hydrolase [Acidobacteriota bacterium]
MHKNSHGFQRRTLLGGLGLLGARPLSSGAAAPRVGQPQVVADPYIRVVRSPNDWRAAPWIGSPSIVRTASGRLLVCHDLFGKDESMMNTAYMLASDDNGNTWKPVARLHPMFWPSLFRCASGLYVIGTDARYHAGSNHAVISRSGDDGRTWTPPVRLTEGLAVHTGNVGVLVSSGRVTRAFEIVPAMSKALAPTVTTAPSEVTPEDLEVRAVRVRVADSHSLVPHTLVALESGKQVLNCRVLASGKGEATLRPERWTSREGVRQMPVNSPGPWRFPAGAAVRIVSGTSGSNRDFLVMVMDADEHADLCRPESWRKSALVGNPAYTYAPAMKEIFGFDFRDTFAGWLEGVLVRLEHPGGSNGIVDLLRVANNVTGNLSARIAVDDSGTDLKASFERYAFDPGLGCTHCYVLYDAAGKLYWMTSNVNRDSTRDLSGTKIESMRGGQERSNLALYYSRNCVDWFMAGLIAYSPDWVHSFHYPHFIIDGDDLLVIARSHVESPLTERTVSSQTAGHHNSNAATFHRVRNFRSLANMEFINYTVA